MRRQQLAALLLTLLLVATPTVAGAETTEAGTATTETGVQLQDVTVQQLQLQGVTVTNATIERLRVDELDAGNTTLGNGTYANVTVEELSLPGVTPNDLGVEADGQATPTEMPTGNDTGEGNVTATRQSSTTVQSLTIETVSVNTLAVSSLVFRSPGEAANETADGMDNATETPSDVGIADNETEASNETETETGNETDTGTETETDTETETSTDTAAGNVGGLAAQQAQEGQRVEVTEMRIDQLSIGEMVVILPEGTSTTAEDETESPTTDQNETADGMDNATETPGDVGIADNETEAGNETETEAGNETETGNATDTGTDTGLGTETETETAGVGDTETEAPGDTPTDSGVGTETETEAGGTTPGVTTGQFARGQLAQANDTQETTVDNVSVDTASATRAEARFGPNYTPLVITEFDAPGRIEAPERFNVTITAVNTDDEQRVAYVSYTGGFRSPDRQLVTFEAFGTQTVNVTATTAGLARGGEAQIAETNEMSVSKPLLIPGDNQTTPEPNVETGDENDTETDTETDAPGETETETGTEAEPETETEADGIGGTETETETDAGTP